MRKPKTIDSWCLNSLIPRTVASAMWSPKKWIYICFVSFFLIADAQGQIADAQGQEPNCQKSIYQAGDANRDLKFDQLDIVRLRVAGKYLTGKTATWGEGDWNGDSLFDESDIVAALGTDNYLKGPYAVVLGGRPPSPRGGAPAVWLASKQHMMLFGGMNPITADSHTLSSTLGWQEITQASSPARRCHHTLVNYRDTALLFGGFTTSGGREGRFNDTYRFDPSTSTWVDLNPTGDLPAPRCLHTAVWIPSRNEMMVYGGIQGGGRFPGDYFLDTHILDIEGNRWRRLEIEAGPGARAGSVSFYSSRDDAAYLWGGLQITTQAIGYPQGLWRFDPQRSVWEEISTSGSLPTGREDPTYFWDDANGRLFLFHGRNELLSSELVEQESHVLHVRERRWEQIETNLGPSSRWRASVAFDPRAGCGWMFGGWEGFIQGMLGDTWKFDIASRRWLQVCFHDSSITQ